MTLEFGEMIGHLTGKRQNLVEQVSLPISSNF